MSSSPDEITPALRPPKTGKVGLGTVGMLLFLAALFMLFSASLLGYIIIRIQATQVMEMPLANGYQRPAVPLGALHLPTTLWVSTGLVLGVSLAISLAQSFFARGLQQPYRKALIAALALAAGFVSVQTPAMVSLLASQKAVTAAAGTNKGVYLYGLVFFLVLLHALHVLGGMIALGRLSLRVQHGGYDPADANPTRHVAMYWHFLDLVWLAMFATFYLMK